MPHKSKLSVMSTLLGVEDMKKFIINQYVGGMSCNEISAWINERTGKYVTITTKSISDIIPSETTRSKGDAFKNAISRGRMTYKTKDKLFKRQGIYLGTRYKVLQRDNFKCKCCGSTNFLEVDHIIPVMDGGTNDLNNLQTLCKECNMGKYQAGK